jgi:hypothetical protein
MTKERILLMVGIGVVPTEIEAEWNNWYDSQHIACRLRIPGFISARRFVKIEGEYKYLTLYDLISVDVLTSEAYIKLRDREASLPPDSFEAITRNLPNFFRGVYKQIYPGQGEYQIPDTEIIFAIGHDVPSNREEEFNAWYNTEHIPAMMNGVPGFITARRFVVIENLPSRAGATTTSPKYVTLYDLESAEVLRSDDFLRETNSPWSSWVRSWYSRRFRIIAQRIYPEG